MRYHLGLDRSRLIAIWPLRLPPSMVDWRAQRPRMRDWIGSADRNRSAREEFPFSHKEEAERIATALPGASGRRLVHSIRLTPFTFHGNTSGMDSPPVL